MDCFKIIKNYLEKNGFDGLHNGCECGCKLDDLIPCDRDFSLCRAGYLVIPPENGYRDYDFYICDSATERPWDDEAE